MPHQAGHEGDSWSGAGRCQDGVLQCLWLRDESTTWGSCGDHTAAACVCQEATAPWVGLHDKPGDIK
ncbi:hypothetical protein E2C01_019212 [Portunus trituberculatus]|uniref:SRCR domain-containing protein n=1 Tax=Portunus trituberculatus TaxID=210409 RepID=A0A5B7DWP1_PORTR|nr:hypothetical protein [Portunus trituberculatus]